jgi:hypothetical protein
VAGGLRRQVLQLGADLLALADQRGVIHCREVATHGPFRSACPPLPPVGADGLGVSLAAVTDCYVSLALR